MDGTEAARKRVILTAARDGQSLRISVLDSGTGLPEQSDVLERFFSTEREGLCLGLRIARSIGRSPRRNALGGDATQNGVCFHFTVPLHRMPADDSAPVPGLPGR